MDTHKLSVLICNADYLSSQGIQYFLQSNQYFKILASLINQDQLEYFLQQKQPDIVIIDYYLNGSFGTDSISLIREQSPETKIMVISNDHNKQRIFEVLERGVTSYITKMCGKDEILKALDSAARGEKFFCSKVLDFILEKSFDKKKEQSPIEDLTEREKEILKHVSLGKTAKEISSELHISIHTIYTHRKNIMKKLGLKSPMELIMHALNYQDNV